MQVLIETYWNVNDMAGDSTVQWANVLIETYWNVNNFEVAAHKDVMGINRNILECKLRFLETLLGGS